jgi:predicted Zn-dependent protease
VLALAVGSAALAEKKDELDKISDLPRGSRLALFSAQEYIEQGDLQKAADELANYMAEHPDEAHYLLHFHLGNTWLQLEDDTLAFEEYRKAVAAEPRHEDSWLNYGQTAFALERYDVAARAILEGFELSEEKRSELLYYASAAYILGGDAASAIPHLEALTSGDYGEPKYEWHRALVSACVETGDQERGERAVQKMLEQFASDPGAWELAFQYGASVSDYRAATVALTVVGYLRPLTRREQIQLGDLYQAIEVPFVATQYYGNALADSASASEVERLASAYIAAYDLESARTVLEKEIAEEPTFRLYSLLGDLHFMEKRFEPAYEAFARCVELDPEEGRPWLMMGYCAMELERWDDSLLYLTRASEYEDYNERANSLIRRVSRRMQDNS